MLSGADSYRGGSLTAKSRSQFALLIAGGVLLIIAIVSLIAWAILQSRADARNAANITTENLSRTLAENFNSTVRTMDLGLLNLQDEIVQQQNSRQPDHQAIVDAMARQDKRHPDLLGYRIYGADGFLSYGASNIANKKADISRRPDFVFHRDTADSGLLVGPAKFGAAAGQWTISVSRRITKRDGSFGGIVICAISTNSLSESYAKLNVGPLGSVALAHANGELAARFPDLKRSGDLAVTIKAAEPLRSAIASGTSMTQYDYRSGLDDVLRTATVRRIEGQPYFVQVGLAQDDYLEDWKRNSTRLAIFGALVVGLILVAMVRLHRRISASQAAAAALAAANETAETAIRAAKAAHLRLQLALDSAKMGIWDWDVASGALIWDERMYALYGVTAESFDSAYDAWLAAVSVEDQARANRAIELALAEVQPYDIEFRVRHPDGTECWIKANGLVTRNETGQAVSMAGVNYDITERKNAEVALLAAKQAAEDANRAKSNFLATMSHEIRTPMNGILGMLKLLQHTELTTRQLDYTSKAEGATKALLGIINDILDFSKVEAGKLELNPEPTVLGEVMRELSVILSSNLGNKNVEALFALGPDVPPVLMVDGLRLRQVLLNLAGNALKFTEQGEVVIGIKLLGRDADGADLEFSVRDTGIGIPADKLGYIFEGFSQAESSTTRRFGGTGLGLAISQRLVALMGGTLKVESEYGKGSQFYFAARLALAPEISPAVSAGGESDQGTNVMPALLAPAGGPMRVLIVEDHALAREILQTMAESMGWQVECSVSGEAALVQLQQPDAPSYDLILMDWRMPGIDGWETTRKIRQLTLKGRPPVVIMVTAAGRELLSEKPASETDLIDGYLVKPITASMLYEAVAEAVVERNGGRVTHQAQTSQRLAGVRLLVVEDNLLNQQIAQELLERSGAVVSIAGGGLEGVAQALAATPPFDAILMDVQMPDIDGLEATRRLRAEERMRDVPIIAMTANAMESDKEACSAAGMVDHVAKPIDLDALIATILRHVSPRPTHSLTAKSKPKALAPLSPPLITADGAVIDVDAAIRRLGGSRDFYGKVVASFRSDAALLLRQFQQHIEAADFPQAQRCAHTLKGLSATVGAKALAGMAEHAEVVLKRILTETGTPDTTGLSEVSNSMSAQFNETLAALPLASPSAPEPEHAVAPAQTAGDRAALNQSLEALAECLKRRDMRSTKLGEQLRQEFGDTLDGAAQDQLTALASALRRLDFSNSLQACTALQQEFNK